MSTWNQRIPQTLERLNWKWRRSIKMNESNKSPNGRTILLKFQRRCVQSMCSASIAQPWHLRSFVFKQIPLMCRLKFICSGHCVITWDNDNIACSQQTSTFCRLRCGMSNKVLAHALIIKMFAFNSAVSSQQKNIPEWNGVKRRTENSRFAVKNVGKETRKMTYKKWIIRKSQSLYLVTNVIYFAICCGMPLNCLILAPVDAIKMNLSTSITSIC